MIFHEFAVEPTSVASWQDFRYITEKFGVHRGRLISRFPKEWEREVIQACHALPDIEKARIIEKLGQEGFRQGKTVDLQRPYDDCLAWFTNASKQHNLKPFHGIIATENVNSLEFVVTPEEINEDTPILIVSRGTAILRTKESIAATLATLFANCREIIFVDPHFDPSRAKFTKPLSEYVKAATHDGRTLACCEYHLKHKGATAAHFGNYARFLPHGIKFVQWDDDESAEQMHPRYILTDLGGVRIDKGLDEEPGGETTDIVLLDIEEWERCWEWFRKRKAPFKVAAEFVLKS